MAIGKPAEKKRLYTVKIQRNLLHVNFTIHK